MDIIIASKAKLFVCAIGVPPKGVVERLHKAGIVVMKYVSRFSNALRSEQISSHNSMVGHPKVLEPPIPRESSDSP